jgi:succinyl-CoA synthetase beta subunit
LLRGFRGAPAADLEAVAKVVVAIGNAALSLGPGLNALEVNPLRVNGSEVECLDGLVVWTDNASTGSDP